MNQLNLASHSMEKLTGVLAGTDEGVKPKAVLETLKRTMGKRGEAGKATSGQAAREREADASKTVRLTQTPAVKSCVRRLRRGLTQHLKQIGWEAIQENGDRLSKEDIRAAHAAHRDARSAREAELIQRRGRALVAQFAEGPEVEVARIAPYLVEVRADTPEGDLFRAATLFWSVPVSRGYGRRLRFLVMDGQNSKLIGIVALGDPVFNLTCRDEWIGWDVRTREQRLVNVMDAYVLGAVPPYASLIGGKLVAAMVASHEINMAFAAKYGRTVSTISEKPRDAQLALVTTTSALGRSSLYNRLRLPGLVEYRLLGMTKGFGHFQVPDEIFNEMRELLTLAKHPYADGHGFGQGPNWRVRVIRVTLKYLRMPQTLLQHGIKREAYGVPLATNWQAYLRGEETRAQFALASVKELGEACVARWMLPRAIRDGAFREWTREQTWAMFKERTGIDE
jgi:Domain of unknown function (DUF4338)